MAMSPGKVFPRPGQSMSTLGMVPFGQPAPPVSTMPPPPKEFSTQLSISRPSAPPEGQPSARPVSVSASPVAAVPAPAQAAPGLPGAGGAASSPSLSGLMTAAGQTPDVPMPAEQMLYGPSTLRQRIGQRLPASFAGLQHAAAY